MINSTILFRKILISWLFPPGIIIIAILLLSLLFIFNKKKIATFLTLFLIAILFLLSSWLGEYILVKPLEDDYIFSPPILSDNYNLSNPIIVVLAGDMVNGSFKASEGNAEIGEVTLSRLVGAYFLYLKINCPFLVSGGTVPGFSGDIPAADVMQQFLIDLGVPEEDIYTETQSRSTIENATFTMDMIRKQNFQEVILVTSAIHMPRAMFAFQNSDIPVIPYPVNFLYENISPGLLNIFPNRSSWEHNLRALHEWVGLLYYKLLI